MNRHEVEERLRMVERKVQFLFHTMALTRTDNTTGQTESRTFDTLFNEAIDRGMDPTDVAKMARASIGTTPTGSVAPKADGAGSTPGSNPFPDGFARGESPPAK